ncbi:hypothetical protein V7150_16065 [Neobacillus drentensis]|uniref:hypothetical protein n=1 Tax=Neobacillus drentensis TaxID=220684 RepID=UPI0030002884
MSVIAQDVFIMAMNLMDEESQDGTFAGYPDEYKRKAWSILTMLQAELLPPSATPMAVTSENNVIQIDDRTSLTTLPYGLAAHLLMDEDQSKSAFFNSRYDELKRKRPAKIVPIKDVYGFAGEQEETSDPTTIELDGGSFLDPNNVIYDRGEF